MKYDNEIATYSRNILHFAYAHAGNAINAPTITQAQHMSFTSGSKAVKANLIERLL
jgi:hypothetical protein